MIMPPSPDKSCRSSRHQTGMSLIELMIAMAVGLVLLAALTSLYVATSKARTEFNKTSEQIENGRFALQSITRDVEMSGFYGRAATLGAPNYAVPDVCATTPSSMGFSASPLTVPLPVYGPALAPTVLSCLTATLPNQATGAEVLTVSYVAGDAIAPASASSANYYLQRSGCQTDAAQLIYNKSAGAFTLHNKSPDGVAACNTSANAEVRQYVERSYYVATCDVCTGASADTTPTLKVAEFVGGVIKVSSLVSGIQDVHYSYGIDTDNNGSPDCYVDNPFLDNSATCTGTNSAWWTASTTTNWSNVTAVRINLLSRNLDLSAGWNDTRSYDLGRTAAGVSVPDGPYNDQIKRHVYSTTARVWNTGGARENQ